jgi:hypothetical protein
LPVFFTGVTFVAAVFFSFVRLLPTFLPGIREAYTVISMLTEPGRQTGRTISPNPGSNRVAKTFIRLGARR